MAGMTDVISLAQFQDELRRIARFDVSKAPDNPLSAALQKINDNPACGPARLLGRMLTALTHECGEFRRRSLRVRHTDTSARHCIDECGAYRHAPASGMAGRHQGSRLGYQ